mgnify:CR=1 FL=1
MSEISVYEGSHTYNFEGAYLPEEYEKILKERFKDPSIAEKNRALFQEAEEGHFIHRNKKKREIALRLLTSPSCQYFTFNHELKAKVIELLNNLSAETPKDLEVE